MNEWKVIPTHIGFYNSCANCLRLVDFLYSKLDLSSEHYLKGIQVSCEANKPDILKYLVDKHMVEINISFVIEMYQTMCKTGYIEIILLFFHMFPVELLIYDNCAYTNACKNNHVDILELIDKTINIFKKDYIFDICDEIFIQICCRNHIHVLQYLLANGYIFKFQHSHYVFNFICSKNYVEIAKIFVAKCTDTYSIEINDKNEIIKYDILQLLPMSSSTINVNEVEQCSICHDNNSNIITECDHQFCYQCLNAWFNKHQSCPYCRNPFESCNKIEQNL
jgi:hypothetical protein